MAWITRRHCNADPAADRAGVASASRPDWRGWIAVAWVVFWGSAYTLTAIQARAPQFLNWVIGLTRNGAHP